MGLVRTKQIREFKKDVTDWLSKTDIASTHSINKRFLATHQITIDEFSDENISSELNEWQLGLSKKVKDNFIDYVNIHVNGIETNGIVSISGDPSVLTIKPYDYNIDLNDLVIVKYISEAPLFELLDNGVTIRYNGSTPGDIGVIDGITYTAIDQTMFDSMDPLVSDFTNVVTTLVDDMSNAFYNQTNFNQNISHWDTINTKNMEGMFFSASSFNQDLSNWCVEQIPMKPIEFDDNTTSWILPKPNWGVSC